MNTYTIKFNDTELTTTVEADTYSINNGFVLFLYNTVNVYTVPSSRISAIEADPVDSSDSSSYVARTHLVYEDAVGWAIKTVVKDRYGVTLHQQLSPDLDSQLQLLQWYSYSSYE